jgi:P pilus assembly chaperone PapD
MIKANRLRYALSSVLAIGIAVPLAAAFGIGLQPTTVEMEVKPGDRDRQVVNIANVHKEKTISLTLGLADWSLDEAGQIKLSPPGETVDSSAEWVRFSPAFVTLKPGESEQIVVDMATPSRLERSGDFRFALLASTVLPEERGGQSGVWKKYQIASLFYLTAGDATSSPTITNSGLTVTPEGKTKIDLRIENDGNAHARLEGSIEIKGADGARQSIPVGNLVVLNEGARDFSAELVEPLPANADIEVRLDNIFAPQSEGAIETLAPYKVETEIKKAALAAPMDTAGSAQE